MVRPVPARPEKLDGLLHEILDGNMQEETWKTVLDDLDARFGNTFYLNAGDPVYQAICEPVLWEITKDPRSKALYTRKERGLNLRNRDMHGQTADSVGIPYSSGVLAKHLASGTNRPHETCQLVVWDFMCIYMLLMKVLEESQEVAGAAALKEVSTLREAVFRGQDDVLKAVDMLKQELVLLRQSRSGGDYPAAGTVTSSPSTVPPGKIQSAAVADWLLAPAPAEAAPLQNPRTEDASPPSTVSGDQPKGQNGLRWDSSVLKRQESMAESQYWYQRREKNVRPNAAFSHYMANWPCIWGEEYVGIGAGDGNKWMCGARLIQKPCVVYSFGSNRNIQFEKGIHNLGVNCEVHIYDPTSSAPHEAIQLGFKYHRTGLGGTDGWQNGLPVKTLATLMRENGHSHLDVLKVDIERAEHAAVKQIASDGWPSVGQFLVEVHIDSDAPQARRAQIGVAKVRSNATSCWDNLEIPKKGEPVVKPLR
ncbi:Mettl24 [Symbiodinium sp. KB8]|nr:Mettl24 [Symbiodinium sp. KB8]